MDQKDQSKDQGMPAADSNSNNHVHDDKLMAYLAYIIFFIPLIVGMKTPFVKFHTNQGTVLFIFSFAIQFVLPFLYFIPLFGLIAAILRLGIFVLWIIGLVNVSQGKMKELPVIGHISIIK